METTTLNISYDTSRNSRFPLAYTVSLNQIGDVVRPLAKRGETWNNITRYEGTFPTRAAAIRAVLDYIASPCVILERRDLLNDTADTIVKGKLRARNDDPSVRYTVLGSNSRHGRFVAVDT